MVAVYIDPAICHTWAGWLIPECYGIAVMTGVFALTAALTCAASVRRLAQR